MKFVADKNTVPSERVREGFHQPLMRPGDRLEPLDAQKLPFKGPVIFERVTVDQFDGAQSYQRVRR